MTAKKERERPKQQQQQQQAPPFEELLDRYYSPVFSLLCKWTGHWHDAEDLTQETFLKAYKYLNSYRPDQDFKNWVYRIALNIAHEHYAATRKREQIVELEETVEQHIVPAPGADAEARASRQQQLRRIYAILPELTVRERSVFVLKTLEGMGNDEIAQILGITETTVRRFFGLARGKIVDKLEQKEQNRGNTSDEMRKVSRSAL